MADENNRLRAIEVFNTLCNAIEKREWKYEKESEKLTVHFGVSGEDIPMQFILIVDEDRQLIRLMSPLPFNMSEEKRVEGAIATCVASFSLADGNFDYDFTDGSIFFRLTASFRGSLIGENLLQYMISAACTIVDEYNDRFLMLDKGLMTIEKFIELG